MSDEIESDGELGTPIWAAFGDLMSVLLGAFVLILVGVIGVQLQLSSRLDAEVKQRQAEAQRRQTLEQALAAPLAAGRVTLVDGRIGIRGNVLFAFNSDQLQPEGREVLKSLARPLTQYLRARRDPDGQRIYRRPPSAGRQSPLRRQLGTVRATRAHGDPCPDRRRRAGVIGVRGRIRLAATGGFQRRRSPPREKSPRGDRADRAPVVARRRIGAARSNHRTAMSKPALSVRAQLERWRSQGADRLDPVHFHLMETLAARADAQADAVREVLEHKLGAMASIVRDTAALQAHLTQAVQQQLDGITHGFQTSASTTAQHWSMALAAQERAQQTHNAQLQATLEQIAAHSVAVQDSVSSAVHQQLQGVSAAIEQNARTATEHWQVALSAQERTQATLAEQLQGTLEQIDQRSVAVQDSVTQAVQSN